MTIHGSCLCGLVRFQFEEATGPFEICHCNRCRKLSGAQGMPGVTVLAAGYEMTEGRESVSAYAAPIIYKAPAYQSYFCSNCGSPLPAPEPEGEHVEIPAGLLDDDPGLRPDKHIFTEFVPPWYEIKDGLPLYDINRLTKERHGRELADDFQLRSHFDTRRDSTD